MKIFICALSVLLAEIIFIIFICLYISDFSDKLLSYAELLPTSSEALSSDSVSIARAMEALAYEKGCFFNLLINNNEWRSIMTKISELRTRIETGSFEDYYSKLSELKYELSEFKESEGFSVKSIL